MSLTLSCPIPPADLPDWHRLPMPVRTNVLRWWDLLGPLLPPPGYARHKGITRKIERVSKATGVSIPQINRWYGRLRSHGWRGLVHKGKAGPAWQDRQGGAELTIAQRPLFLDHLGRLFGNNQRACRPAYDKLLRQWRRWRQFGDPKDAIPGYDTPPPPHGRRGKHPLGWSYENLLRHKPETAELKIMRIGTAAAAAYLPCIPGTRVGVRWLEYVFFDDVWHDRDVMVPNVVNSCRLLQLGCLDYATGYYPKFGVRPEIPLENGKRERLKERDMLWLVAAFLGQYGYPLDYVMHLIVERGTATLRAADAKALYDYSGGQIRVGYTSMQGEFILAWQEASTGNPRGKSPLESWHNLFHNELADQPGQIGKDREHQPARLADQRAEAVALNKIGRQLNPEQRSQLKLPFPSVEMAHAATLEAVDRINRREVHDLEGFEKALYWRVRGAQAWEPEAALLGSPLAQLPAAQRDALIEYDARAESPFQRMQRLSHGQRFAHVPGYLLKSFVEDKRKTGRIDKATFGFELEGRRYEYLPPAPEDKLPEGTELVAHFSPFDLNRVHLSDGQGRFVGTWRRFGPFGRDAAAQAEAQRTRRAYLNYARRRVERMGAPDAAQLLADRLHNEQVIADAGLMPAPGADTLAEFHERCTPAASQLQEALQAGAARTAAEETRASGAGQPADDFSPQQIATLLRAASQPPDTIDYDIDTYTPY